MRHEYLNDVESDERRSARDKRVSAPRAEHERNEDQKWHKAQAIGRHERADETALSVRGDDPVRFADIKQKIKRFEQQDLVVGASIINKLMSTPFFLSPFILPDCKFD